MATLYFPIINQNDKFVAKGKIEVLDPVSTNFIDVYTYNATDDSYTVVNNPIYLNGEGRSEHTYFVKQLSYLRLYKYLGDFSDPRTDDESANWQFVRDWFNSIELNTSTGSNLDVYGLYGLMDADTSLGTVDVVGYWTDDDCEKRTYVWDKTCTAQPDAGYVVQSNSTEEGRWILLFDGEYLPSTYYGVYPGHEENVNALLTYPSVVGSNELITAPGVYFVSGNYNGSSVALVTEKKLLIDNESSFTRTSITSSNEITVIGGETNHYITDLYGVKKAHSSWYKTLQGFLDSGAKELIFDQNINVTQAPVMKKNTTLHNVHLVNNTNMYAGWMGFNNFMLTLDRCIVDDHLFYPSTSRIFFQNMLVTDRYFYLPTVKNIDISRINCDDFNFNLFNFDNAEIYLKWMYQKGNTDIDMQGRLVSDIDFAPSLTGLHNCRFNTLTLNDSSKLVFLENCQGILRSVNSANLIIYNCRLTLDTNLALAQSGLLNIKDSVITGSGDIQAGADFGLMIEHSTLEPSITCPSVTNINGQPYDVIVKSSTVGVIELKKLEMTNSKAGTIKIYGSASAASHTIGNVKLENNVIDDFGFFAVTGFEQYVSNCTFVQTRIVNNTFNNSFTCPFYAKDSGGNKYEFISSTGNHDYLYKGNHGNCPIDSIQVVTKLPYTDGAYKDASDHEWPLELTHTFRMFLPGERLIKGTVLGAKMIEMFTSYGSDTQVINHINYGLFHAGSLDAYASDNDYFHMCLANDFPALDTSVITWIKL